jgi:hypothetical protein
MYIINAASVTQAVICIVISLISFIEQELTTSAIVPQLRVKR